MRSRYICFCGPLPVMIAKIGGSSRDGAREAYAQRDSRRRLKSSSGVQEVLLTNNFVSPAIILVAYLLVSTRFCKNFSRSSGFEIGWKMAAGRSWSVRIGDLILYGLLRNCFAIARVTVNENVGARLPRMIS